MVTNAVAAPAAVAMPEAAVAPPVAIADHPGAIKSPMVGTAFLGPQPGAASFVKPGDRVVPGQTLMIVEAMKVMNPITAPRAGLVHAVLVEDGAPVEYGQPLAVLE